MPHSKIDVDINEELIPKDAFKTGVYIARSSEATNRDQNYKFIK